MKIYYPLFAVGLLLAFGCNADKGKRWKITASKLPAEKVDIKAYGKTLFELDTTQFIAQLQRYQAEFPEFLNSDLNDTSNTNKLLRFVKDPFLRQLSDRANQVFPATKTLENSLSQIYSHLHYHFPEFSLPQPFTYISGLQIEAPVMAAGQTLVIALDCYLGAAEPLYEGTGIPAYRLSRMDAAYLPTDVAKTLFAVYFDPGKPTAKLLDEMIEAGKRSVFMEALLPQTAPHILLGYSAEQYEWVKKYEAEVWRSLIGEQLLYSSEPLLFRKFFGDGPYTKEFSTESPPRLGEYIGWQIMRNFMNRHPEVDLRQMLLLNDAQQILSGSRYKPS